MASFHVTVSDSVFPNLDPARQVLATIGAELRMADTPTPEGIVAAAAASDGLLVTYAKIKMGKKDLDMVVANVRFVLRERERDTLLLNDGKGVFTPAPEGWQPPAGDYSNFTIQAHDLEDDGDIDIVAPNTLFGPAAGDYRVLLNNGSARFTAARPDAVLPASADGNGFDVEVADFDGDGQKDLLLCNRASLRNDPEGSGGVQRLLLRRAR